MPDSGSVELRPENVERYPGEVQLLGPEEGWSVPPAEEFRALPVNSRLEFGRNAPPTLLRVDLHPPHAGRWWIVSALRTPGHIEARLGSGPIQEFGSAHPFGGKAIGTFDQALGIYLDGRDTTLFLRVHEPLGPCNLRVLFVPDTRIAEVAQAKSFVTALVIGYLSAILLVGLYLWWAIRERAFGWYVAYIFGAICWFSIKQGVAFAWVWPDHPEWNPHASPSAAFFSIGFLCLFLVNLLQLRRNHAWLGKILDALTGIIVVFAGLSWSTLATRSAFLRHLADATLLGIVTGLAIALVLRVRAKDRMALQLLVAFLPLGLGMSFGALVEFGFGTDGPALKSGILAFSAVLENALTTLVLVREVHRREKARVALERQFHQKVVEKTDAHLGELAQELHDDISQQIALLGMHIHSLRRSGEPPDLVDMEDRMGMLSRSIRGISHRMRPPLLEQGRLVESLEHLCQELSDTGEVQASLVATPGLAGAPRQCAIHLYRIVQEAVVNAVRHGKATKVVVALEEPRANHLALTVSDDGKGFQVDDTRDGLGLWSIRSRVDSLGGILAIRSAAGGGTRIRVEVPVGAG